jgi:hypothetical protein
MLRVTDGGAKIFIAMRAANILWWAGMFASRANWDQTSRAASAFIAAMPSPTMRSGQAECAEAVVIPAAMIATFATASFRAERNAARVRLPLCSRKPASKRAHDKLIPTNQPVSGVARWRHRRHKIAPGRLPGHS